MENRKGVASIMLASDVPNLAGYTRRVLLLGELLARARRDRAGWQDLPDEPGIHVVLLEPQVSSPISWRSFLTMPSRSRQTWVLAFVTAFVHFACSLCSLLTPLKNPILSPRVELKE